MFFKVIILFQKYNCVFRIEKQTKFIINSQEKIEKLKNEISKLNETNINFDKEVNSKIKMLNEKIVNLINENNELKLNNNQIKEKFVVLKLNNFSNFINHMGLLEKTNLRNFFSVIKSFSLI